MTLNLQGPGLKVKLAVLGYMCPGEKRVLFPSTHKELGFKGPVLLRKILRRTQQWLIHKCVKTMYFNRPFPTGHGVYLPRRPLLYLHFRFCRLFQKHRFCHGIRGNLSAEWWSLSIFIHSTPVQIYQIVSSTVAPQVKSSEVEFLSVHVCLPVLY